MKETKTVVNVTATKDGEVTILTGEAVKPLPLHARLNISLSSSSIDGPSKFWAAKKALYTAVNCHVLYDKVNGKIKLVLMEDTHEKRDFVTGELKDNPELDALGINDDTLVNHNEMMKRLKWARNMFPDRAQYDKLIAAFTNFNAKVETEIKKHNDQTGNIIDSVVTKTKQEVPLNFNLKTNLFIGQQAIQFDVTVIVDVNGRSLVFGLESLSLFEAQNKVRASIIDEELVKMTEIVAIEATLS